MDLIFLLTNIIMKISNTTVDRVLNHRGSVNPQTERKILEIVQALDYKPNKAGIVLAAQKKNLKLGVVLLGLYTVFYDQRSIPGRASQ